MTSRLSAEEQETEKVEMASGVTCRYKSSYLEPLFTENVGRVGATFMNRHLVKEWGIVPVYSYFGGFGDWGFKVVFKPHTEDFGRGRRTNEIIVLATSVAFKPFDQFGRS